MQEEPGLGGAGVVVVSVREWSHGDPVESNPAFLSKERETEN